MAAIAAAFASGAPGQGDNAAKDARLGGSDSGYVRRHVADLVDWHEWSDDVFEKAKKEKKPVFVSIGYDSCHWCHRMQVEAFSDADVASYVNKHFVCVLVDKDRRPDLNHVYMTYMNANHGSGGWPLNVWLTSERVPFSVGSYFPANSSGALPGLKKVVRHIQAQWSRSPEYIEARSVRDPEFLKKKLGDVDAFPDTAGAEDARDLNKTVEAACESISARFDPVHGGFTHPARFPQPGLLRFLVSLEATEPEGSFRARQARKMVMRTATSMVTSGLADQVGGGFHRYTLDPPWEAPRFEKMLDIQAQLGAAGSLSIHFIENSGVEPALSSLEEFEDRLGKR